MEGWLSHTTQSIKTRYICKTHGHVRRRGRICFSPSRRRGVSTTRRRGRSYPNK